MSNNTDRLIEANEGLILQVINKGNFRHVCHGALEVQDLINAGREALWLASKKYTPERGAFSTYATSCIRGAILDMLKDYNAVVYRPEGAPDPYLEKGTDDRFRLDYVGEDESQERAFNRLYTHDPDKKSFFDGQSWMSGPEGNADRLFRREALHEMAVKRWGERNTAIMELYLEMDGEPHTIPEIAERFGLTRQRVGQILKPLLEVEDGLEHSREEQKARQKEWHELLVENQLTRQRVG